MKGEMLPALVINEVVENVSSMIINAKSSLKIQINTSMTLLYWSIGEYLSLNVLKDKKPEYGKNVIGEVSKQLSNQYGKGFERASIFRMIQFYEKFPSHEKVATLSQQLTWSHFIELLPVDDELKREFCITMCKNENWSVRTLRERKKSMLFERTAISK